MKSSSKSSSGLSEQQWVDIIVRSFIKDMDINPCVFRIPEGLSNTKPEAYSPQQIGLGPYHHFRPEFFETETQKCFSVRKFLKPEQNLRFKNLVVDKLKVLEPIMRGCYDKYLDFDGNTLAWIMAIDGSYLLQFVSTYVEQREKDAVIDSDQVQRLAMDILMLENQIPIVLLKEICKSLQLLSNDPVNDLLFHNFYMFCKEQSPLRLTEESGFRDDSGQFHLLGYMYHLIVNNQGKNPRISPVSNPHKNSRNTTTPSIGSILRKTKEALVNSTAGIFKIAASSASAIETAADTAALLGINGAAGLQTHLKLLQTVRQFLPSSEKDQKIDEPTNSVEEIDIPSVSQLCENLKIRFKLRPGGIKDVEFDDQEKIFYLPVISLNPNSEVVLRNLVAYEAQSAARTGSTLELAEYVDLMCGIIDTTKDVNLLRKEGIIEGNLSDENIADIFNGIKKSTGNSNNKTNIEMIVSRVNEQLGKGRRKKKYMKPLRSSL